MLYLIKAKFRLILPKFFSKTVLQSNPLMLDINLLSRIFWKSMSSEVRKKCYDVIISTPIRIKEVLKNRTKSINIMLNFADDILTSGKLSDIKSIFSIKTPTRGAADSNWISTALTSPNSSKLHYFTPKKRNLEFLKNNFSVQQQVSEIVLDSFQEVCVKMSRGEVKTLPKDDSARALASQVNLNT